MTDFDRIFSEFNDADPTQVTARTPKLDVDGEHVVEIEKVTMIDSQQFNGVLLIVEFRPVSSSHESIKLGQSYSWTCDVTKTFGPNKVGLNNAKQFLAAALGMEADTPEAMALGGKHIEDAVSEDNPLAGRRVAVHTNPRMSQENRSWTMHNWSPTKQKAA